MEDYERHCNVIPQDHEALLNNMIVTAIIPSRPRGGVNYINRKAKIVILLI